MRMDPNDPTQDGLAPAGDVPASVLSRNEIETLSAKAARGAGLSWGHAEEAGFAVGWLHAQGLDGAAALLAHLEQAAGRTWTEVCPIVGAGRWRAPGRAPICPVALGAALSDHCELPEGDLAAGLAVGPVSYPILVVPFLGRIAALLGRAVVARAEGVEVTIGPETLAGDAERLAGLLQAELKLSLAAGIPETGRAPCYDCTGSTLGALGALALRTTVPPSDRSRVDAGADTSDND